MDATECMQSNLQSNDLFSEWLRSSNLIEYAENFKDNGFDDLDLLKSMEEDEISGMIEALGIKKRGHVLKLKKCLSWLKAPVNTRPLDLDLHHPKTTAPKKVKQTTLTFCQGQFVLGRETTAVDSKFPWHKVFKPHPKTNKIRFYNDVTREIYESAYVGKQSQFASYLNGQQQFRWDVTEKIRNLEGVLRSYEEGLIPKESIMIKRYLEMPDDPTLRDVSHASRALEHVKSTFVKTDELLEMLKKRNLELYDRNSEVKRWAKNEAEVIHGYISSIKELKGKLVRFEDNLKFVTTSLQKKFSSSKL